MSTWATLVASIAIVVSSGSQSPTISTEQHTFTQGMTPIRDCRKYEAAYHSGNGESTKRGMKTVSRFKNPDGFIYEVTTFCVEEN